MSMAESDRTPRDLIGKYLAQVRASLRVAPDEAELIMAEADHLRETAAVALAAGMTEREAQGAAISAFGSVRAVARAHEAVPGHLTKGRTFTEVPGDLFLAAWKLGSLGLAAVGPAAWSGYFPVLATCVSGAGALSLTLAQLTGFTVKQGPGTYLSGAIVAAAVAIAHGVRARPVIRHLRQRFANGVLRWSA